MFSPELEQKIAASFEQMMELYGEKGKEIRRKMKALEPDTAVCMKYLYGKMPLSDGAGYSFEVFLDYARHGVWLWHENSRCREAGEELFLPYILYHRINTEDITPCRSLFCALLEGKTTGESMEQDILAVNYWCASQATYRATDDRTASPLTVLRSGFGRCGEESVFTVTALRSVGIPARQVYAPRWSHCDDNHAWVEAWCDGEWRFLGACEPEEILDRGWFTNASSRAMLVHSKFNGFDTDEEIIGSQGRVTILNHLSRYARTRKVKVRVLSREGSPLPGIPVSLSILNYAQMCVIAQIQTGKDGWGEFTTGEGTLLVQAFLPDGMLEQALAPSEVEAVLKEGENLWSEGERELEFLAPADAPIHTKKPDERQKEAGKDKLVRAVAVRMAKDRTNGEIRRFRSMELGDKAEPWKEKLLNILPEKDLRDMKAEVLANHLLHALPYEELYTEEIFLYALLNPRIQFEQITDYRSLLAARVSREEQKRYRENPGLLWKKLGEEIRELPQWEDPELVTSPAACLEISAGSLLSRRILFVAMCRSIGIAARLNPVTGAPECYREGAFWIVEEGQKADAVLVLLGDASWKYEQNFTVARLSENGFATLSASEASWKEGAFSMTLSAGKYRLVTANRLPNGNIFSVFEDFVLQKGQKKEMVLRQKDARLEEMLEELVLPEFVCRKPFAKEKKPSEALLKEGISLNIWLEESKEPTEHILNELRERSGEVNQSGVKVRFFIRSESAMEDVTLKKTCAVLNNYEFWCADFQEQVEMLARRMYVDPEKLPLIIAANREGRGVYAASGYNVGTADMLLRVFEAVEHL